MESYKSAISESSTRRFFKKIGQSFKGPNIKQHSEYYISTGSDFNNYSCSPNLQPLKTEAETKISILPLLKNAGLQVEKLHIDVINALNQLSIVENIPTDLFAENQINLHKIANKEKSFKNRNLDSAEFIIQDTNNLDLNQCDSQYKKSNLILKNSSNFKTPELFEPFLGSPNKEEKPQSIVLQSEIYGDFDRFQSERPWRERKKQYNFKHISRNELFSERILKSIDDVLKIKIKERALFLQLIGSFENFLSLQNKLYLNEESIEVIQNLIKIIEVEKYNSQCNSQLIESLQNFIFGIYVREGTVKKCHTSLLTTTGKVDGTPQYSSNNIDLTFYYEELTKAKKNFQEDSKNYADYIAQGGSIFILNLVAEMHNVFFKTENLYNTLFLERFDYLSHIYPKEMLDKLYRYNMNYKKPNWDVFDIYLKDSSPIQRSTHQPESFNQNLNCEEPVEQFSINENDQNTILPKSKKIKSHKNKVKPFKFDYDEESDLDILEKNATLHMLKDLHINTNSDNSSKLEKLSLISNTHTNLETTTAVENLNKDEDFTPTSKKK